MSDINEHTSASEVSDKEHTTTGESSTEEELHRSALTVQQKSGTDKKTLEASALHKDEGIESDPQKGRMRRISEPSEDEYFSCEENKPNDDGEETETDNECDKHDNMMENMMQGNNVEDAENSWEETDSEEEIIDDDISDKEMKVERVDQKKKVEDESMDIDHQYGIQLDRGRNDEFNKGVRPFKDTTNENEVDEEIEREYNSSSIRRCYDTSSENRKPMFGTTFIDRSNQGGTTTKPTATDSEIYCICRTADIDRFMIACDKCMEWYHGDCVGVINKKAAKKIEVWYCPNCLEKSPNTQIKYKKKKGKEKKIDGDAKNHIRTSRQCGECPSCIRTTDCAVCDFCMDMKKHGGPGKLRQKCRMRQCLLLSRVRKRDCDVKAFKKYVQSCKKTTADLVNVIQTEHQYTKPRIIPPKEATNTLAPIPSYSVRPTINTLLEVAKEESNEKPQLEQSEQSEPQVFDHSYSMKGVKDMADKKDIKVEEKDDYPPVITSKKKTLKVKRASGHKTSSDSISRHTDDKNRREMERKRKLDAKKEKENIKRMAHDSMAKANLELPERTTRSARRQRGGEKEEKEVELRHCLGPGCVNAARVGSKYCCHECGVQLQIRRLQVILPTRLARKDCNYYANELMEKKIKGLQETQKKCDEELIRLEQELKAFEEMASKAKGLTVLEEEENEDEEDSNLDLTTYCVSCGIALAPRIAMRHMEKCWGKLECMMSFGALMKSHGNLFCDTYMASQGTYCKRLKVICPEHYKERKVEANEICGCPLNEEDGSESIIFCRTASKKCTRHVAWDRLRRGEIDLKRVHQWWKLEEANDAEKQLRFDSANRHNVLGLLLNDTIDHTLYKDGIPPTHPHEHELDDEIVDVVDDHEPSSSSSKIGGGVTSDGTTAEVTTEHLSEELVPEAHDDGVYVNLPNETNDELGTLQNEGDIEMKDLPNETNEKLGILQNEGDIKMKDLPNETNDKLGILQNEGDIKMKDLPNETNDELGTLQNEGDIEMKDPTQKTSDVIVDTIKEEGHVIMTSHDVIMTSHDDENEDTWSGTEETICDTEEEDMRKRVDACASDLKKDVTEESNKSTTTTSEIIVKNDKTQTSLVRGNVTRTERPLSKEGKDESSDCTTEGGYETVSESETISRLISYEIPFESGISSDSALETASESEGGNKTDIDVTDKDVETNSGKTESGKSSESGKSESEKSELGKSESGTEIEKKDQTDSSCRKDDSSEHTTKEGSVQPGDHPDVFMKNTSNITEVQSNRVTKDLSLKSDGQSVGPSMIPSVEPDDLSCSTDLSTKPNLDTDSVTRDIPVKSDGRTECFTKDSLDKSGYKTEHIEGDSPITCNEGTVSKPKDLHEVSNRPSETITEKLDEKSNDCSVWEIRDVTIKLERLNSSEVPAVSDKSEGNSDRTETGSSDSDGRTSGVLSPASTGSETDDNRTEDEVGDTVSRRRTFSTQISMEY